VRLKGVRYGAGTLCYTRQVAPNVAAKPAVSGLGGMGLSLGGAAKVGEPVSVAASRRGGGGGGDSDADSEDSDEWMGEVDVEEYKRLRTAVKLRLDDCDHEIAGKLEGGEAGHKSFIVCPFTTPHRPDVKAQPSTLPCLPCNERPKLHILSTLTPLPPEKKQMSASDVCFDGRPAHGDISRKIIFTDHTAPKPAAGSGSNSQSLCINDSNASRGKLKATHLRALPPLAVDKVDSRTQQGREHSPDESWPEGGGGLSKLASAVDAQNPKFQVLSL
jgi:hypothetical protein